MKAPEPLYPCKFCSDEYSWPASDLAWSERYQDWVCGECWCDNCHDDDYEPDERGERLSTFLLAKEAIDSATLRAKATAYEIGMERWCVFSDKGTPIKFFPDQYLWEEPQYASLRKIGFTCRKVRVCEVVEKPALANKEKGTI